MTLNYEVVVILRYSTEFSSFGANYVEDRPILLATKSKPKKS